MNKIVYRLPKAIKLNLGNLQTMIKKGKRAAIKHVDSLISMDYTILNTPQFKMNLKKFLSSSSWGDNDIIEFANYLYYDKVECVHKSEYIEGLPYIIVVVKNEIDKLVNFFAHYKKIGDFNFIFIDNGSTDGSIEFIKKNGGTIFQCLEAFSTHRKLAWINKVYSTLPNDIWTILLDADELLVYDGYESIRFDSIINILEKNRIDLVGAVMIDMFSIHPSSKVDYINNYVYFENNLHEEKSIYCNSVYGGIREREFKNGDYNFSSGRTFLVKKHPVIKKKQYTLLIHCHYIYPYYRNYKSKILFGLLHYKLFDAELLKYKAISETGSYGNGSVEYKSYLKKMSEKTYEEIFAISNNTIRYVGSSSLKKIKCIRSIHNLHL